LLLWPSVVMGVAGVSICPSLLTSRAINIKAARRYYDAWSL
jgi:hypothetical protein